MVHLPLTVYINPLLFGVVPVSQATHSWLYLYFSTPDSIIFFPFNLGNILPSVIFMSLVLMFVLFDTGFWWVLNDQSWRSSQNDWRRKSDDGVTDVHQTCWSRHHTHLLCSSSRKVFMWWEEVKADMWDGILLCSRMYWKISVLFMSSKVYFWTICV